MAIVIGIKNYDEVIEQVRARMNDKTKLVALDQTLCDTNRLLCIIADTLFDILVTIDDTLDDEIIASRMFAVMTQRMKLSEGEVDYEDS